MRLWILLVIIIVVAARQIGHKHGFRRIEQAVHEIQEQADSKFVQAVEQLLEKHKKQRKQGLNEKINESADSNTETTIDKEKTEGVGEKESEKTADSDDNSGSPKQNSTKLQGSTGSAESSTESDKQPPNLNKSGNTEANAPSNNDDAPETKEKVKGQENEGTDNVTDSNTLSEPDNKTAISSSGVSEESNTNLNTNDSQKGSDTEAQNNSGSIEDDGKTRQYSEGKDGVFGDSGTNDFASELSQQEKEVDQISNVLRSSIRSVETPTQQNGTNRMPTILPVYLFGNRNVPDVQKPIAVVPLAPLRKPAVSPTNLLRPLSLIRLKPPTQKISDSILRMHPSKLPVMKRSLLMLKRLKKRPKVNFERNKNTKTKAKRRTLKKSVRKLNRRKRIHEISVSPWSFSG